MERQVVIGKHHKVALRVWGLVEPVIRRRGLELVDVQFHEGMGGSMLRVFADAPGGISISQLQDLSEMLGPILDAEDPVPGKYTLEVSSPGLDRPLVTRAHFEAAHGLLVHVTTTIKVDGSRKHRGILSGQDPDAILVQVDGAARRIPTDAVDKAHTVYEFPAPGGPSSRARKSKPNRLNSPSNQPPSRRGPPRSPEGRAE